MSACSPTNIWMLHIHAYHDGLSVRYGSVSAINSQSPVSSQRLVNLEKQSFSDSQAPKLDGEMAKYLFETVTTPP